MDEQDITDMKQRLKSIRRYKKRMWKGRKKERIRRERAEHCQLKIQSKDSKHVAIKAVSSQTTVSNQMDILPAELEAKIKNASSQTTPPHQSNIIHVPESRGKSLLKAAIGSNSKTEKSISGDKMVHKRAAQSPKDENSLAEKRKKQAHHEQSVRELDSSLLVRDNDERILGSGTFGKCYAAKYRDISVTVKEYHDHREMKSLATLKKSAYKEAKMILSLHDHPGVPLLFGLCSLTKPVRLSLLFHGDKNNNTSETIYSATKNKTLLDEKSWRNVLCLTAIALNHVHNCGVIHNDLKANNVILEPNLNPVIIDFGQSVKASEAKPRKQSFHNREWKDSYIAPEVRDGTGKPSTSSDIFSFAKMVRFVSSRCCCYASESIDKAISSKPSERPSLDTFISEYSIDSLKQK